MKNLKDKKITAIIAEFNPLHNGHRLLLEESKHLSDYTIVILSGDYVQRGEPAIFNKYTRTKMALISGADLVIELPTVYALSSAEGFSRGAIDIINSLNVCDYLLFGSEAGNLDTLNTLKDLISQIMEHENSSIKESLKSGLNYPAAISEELNKLNLDFSSALTPNNILAIEYLRALSETDSRVTPYTISRSDNGYSNEALSDNEYTSATSIRNALKTSESIKSYVPQSAFALYNENTVFNDSFSQVVYYSLLSKSKANLEDYLDVSSELKDRIINNLNSFTTLSDFEELLKTKSLTRARINRALFHILLDIKKEDAYLTPSYARILGFKKSSKELLSLIKKNSSIPLISKLKDANMDRLLNIDIDAAFLYEKVSCGYLNEYQQSPIIL